MPSLYIPLKLCKWFYFPDHKGTQELHVNGMFGSTIKVTPQKSPAYIERDIELLHDLAGLTLPSVS